MSQLSLFESDASTPAPPVSPDGSYDCPCCGVRVVDEYTDGDSLCCWCRDIDDPRLSESVRQRRLAAAGPRICCLRRLKGKPPLGEALVDALQRVGWTREKINPNAQGYVLRDEHGQLVRPDHNGRPRHLSAYETFDALVHAGHEIG